MSDSKLTAAGLARLAEGATIYGPWRALENGIETGDRYGACGFAMWMDHGTPQDRALVVYLVNHVPEILALLAENERLREVERAAREYRELLVRVDKCSESMTVADLARIGIDATRIEKALDRALAGEAP